VTGAVVKVLGRPCRRHPEPNPAGRRRQEARAPFDPHELLLPLVEGACSIERILLLRRQVRAQKVSARQIAFEPCDLLPNETQLVPGAGPAISGG